MPGDSRGPEQADFAIRRVVASREGLPGPDVWLVLRRPPGADTVRVFLGHAPRRVKPAQLAHLTDARWAIETYFREGPQMAGLASSHDPLSAPALLPAARQAGAQKKQPGLTLYQLAEALEAVRWPWGAACAGTDTPY